MADLSGKMEYTFLSDGNEYRAWYDKSKRKYIAIDGNGKIVYWDKWGFEELVEINIQGYTNDEVRMIEDDDPEQFSSLLRESIEFTIKEKFK